MLIRSSDTEEMFSWRQEGQGMTHSPCEERVQSFSMVLSRVLGVPA